ncbi:MAG TPA: BtrH N-terminal domain-containing protein [Burkholderiales bacterium]|nr:BtrH N-terminal domain-containing protein [Burkholderiales bacterium]
MAFQHLHASHCESGVMSSLLRHHGLALSEPMAFGLASALAFAYLPFIRLNGLPLIAYRMPPGAIVRALDRSLELGVRFETFRSRAAGMARLDALLGEGKVVGLQTSIYWLPYIPPDLRFHFNAHNLLVYGREGDEYLVSDPVAEMPVRCARQDLEKARFATGVLAPKGRLYYLTRAPLPGDWARLAQRALARTAHVMLHTPLPLVGVRGIRWLARAVERLSRAEDEARALLYVGHIVRMQEEIGTGGAGFRFMYGAFLQELAARTGYGALEAHAGRLVEIGDDWQQFAFAAAKMIKRRIAFEPPALAARLRDIAAREQRFFHDLNKARLAWAA